MNTLGPARLIACAGLLLSQPASAAPPRQPVGKWLVDYGDTACTAARNYAPADKPVTLAFRPSPNGTVVRLMVARPGRVPSPHHFDVTTTITSEKAKTTGLRFETTDKKRDIIWINFDRAALDGLHAAGEIAIKAGVAIDERFALPGIADVLKALDRCNADLRKHWNVEDAVGAVPLSQGATALKPLYRLLSPDDYPAQAARERASGSTRIMLMVDETGALKDCLVEETSGIASLDAMSCGVLLQRAKFTPALDNAGKFARSVLTVRISWRIP
jgi:TonB family protein